MSNPLDRKPIKNVLSGKDAKKSQGNRLAQPNKRNLMGLEKGDTQRVARNPLAFPTSRLGLTYRTMQDGVKLIEAIGVELGQPTTPAAPAPADGASAANAPAPSARTTHRLDRLRARRAPPAQV